ncbi:MAG TPA: hypothetical protein PKI19_01050 [Elusimicrobiales bacterium]|nr:hypothetical protein [Elusimicrobiales bacterium]
MEKDVEIDEKEEIRVEIVKSFHEQFAQNQNHHQVLFLQVLAVVLTVITGFGYLYIHFGVQKSDINVTIDTIYISLTLSLYLLSLAIALIINMALGFRRDQMVACNIRMKVEGMDLPNNKGYFPTSFNPVKECNCFNWMPEFYLIFFIALVCIKAIFLVSVMFGANSRLHFAFPPDLFLSATVVMIVFSFYIDGYVIKRYWRKWVTYITEAPEILKNPITQPMSLVYWGMALKRNPSN